MFLKEFHYKTTAGAQPKIRKENTKAEKDEFTKHGLLVLMKHQEACVLSSTDSGSFLSTMAGPGWAVSLHLAPMLGKIGAGSQTIQEAVFSGMALGISIEATVGVGVGEWDVCPKWAFPNKCLKMCADVTILKSMIKRY